MTVPLLGPFLGKKVTVPFSPVPSPSLLEPMPRGFADVLWWAMVTTTTVGYGDITPETPAGRIVPVKLMLAGTALIATIAASVSAYFVGAKRIGEYEDIKSRLDRIEWKLGGPSPRVL